MKDFAGLLSLPTGLLSLLATTALCAEELPWPYNLPRTAKYYPEHEAHIKRNVRVQEQLAWQKPQGVRKMGEDEGEKFLLHYWDLGEEALQPELMGDRRMEGYNNASIRFTAPLAPHFSNARSLPRIPAHNLFARQWGACPQDTSPCSSIDRPDSCCGSNENCIIVTDTGNGDVGCCPDGQTCGGAIAECDTSAGQTSCPNSQNGGCCIAGYECYDVGCVLVNTQTTTVNAPTIFVTVGGESTPATFTSNQDSTYTTTVEVTDTTTVNGVTTVSTRNDPSTVTVTPITVTVTSSTTTAPSTTPNQGPLTCSASFSSCPAFLGGGCCFSGYECGSVSCSGPSTPSSAATALPPQRPTTTTSESETPEASTTTAPAAGAGGDACPTGFYMCEAYYLGGCCRVGRNCDTTSCPSLSSTSVIGAGPTIVVMSSTTTVGNGESTAAAAGETQGSCANGWFGCGQEDGGGCCPGGYVCGAASCSATISGVGPQPKKGTSEASVVRWAWSFFGVALVSAVGMVWL